MQRALVDAIAPRPGSATSLVEVKPRPGKIVAGSFATPLVPDPFATGQGQSPPPNNAGSPVFVYRPGAAATANVYADWPTLMAAVGKVAGPKTIQIDDSIVTPAVIPSSAGGAGRQEWDLHDCVLVGTLTNSRTGDPNVQAQCADGCVFENFSEIRTRLQITSVSTQPVCTMTDGATVLTDLGAIIDSAPGAAPFFDAPGPYTFGGPTIVLGLGCQLGTTPGQFVISIEDMNQGVNVYLNGALSFMPDNVATGAGILSMAFLNAEVFQSWGSPSLPPAQPAMGTFSVADATSSKNLQNYWCKQTDLASPGPAGPWSIPIGYSLLSVDNADPVYFYVVENGLLTRLLLASAGTGNPADAGTSLTFTLTFDGVAVPGASVTLPNAQTGGNGNAQFLAGYDLSHEPIIDLVLTPSAPLNSPALNISAAVA